MYNYCKICFQTIILLCLNKEYYIIKTFVKCSLNTTPTDLHTWDRLVSLSQRQTVNKSIYYSSKRKQRPEYGASLEGM